MNAIKSEARSQAGGCCLSFMLIPAFKLLQTHLQLLQRCVQPALDCAQRQIQRLRDLTKREFFKLLHHHYLPKIDRQGVCFLLLRKRQLASHFRTPLARNALVNSNPVQPGGDFCLAAKATQITKSGEKRLLSGVTGLFLTSKHAVRKRKEAALPAPHNLAESLRSAR